MEETFVFIVYEGGVIGDRWDVVFDFMRKPGYP